MGNVTSEKGSLFEKAVLTTIRENGIVSRTRINRDTHIRLSTITDITKDLLSRGMICEANDLAKSAGESISKKDLLLNKDYCRIIGIDVQSRYVSALLTDFCGNVLESSCIPLGSNCATQQILDAIYMQIDVMISKVQGIKILGIGISTIGIWNRRTGTVMLSFTQDNWNNVNLVSILSSRYPQYPVVAEDQTICKLLAERWTGHVPQAVNSIFVDISDVMGDSLFFNGQIMRNNRGISGEIGHFCVSDGNELCSCGNVGCLCAVASATVVEAKVRAALEKGTVSLLNDMTDRDYDRLNIAMVLEAADRGDRLARNYLDQAAHHIGKAISYMVNLLGPDLVILGGSMISDSVFFVEAIIAEVQRSSLYLMSQDIVFKTAQNENGGALGSVYMVLDQYFEQYSIQ